ncbi:PrgI family protein [Enterococcus mundtii]|nr:PrgI family protein [Enterococcus mundtii]
MAIEVVIRKEIKEYQEKIFFGFSLRQVIVIALALIVILPVGLLNHFIWGYSIDDLGIVLMFLLVRFYRWVGSKKSVTFRKISPYPLAPSYRNKALSISKCSFGGRS